MNCYDKNMQSYFYMLFVEVTVALFEVSIKLQAMAVQIRGLALINIL